MAGIGKQENCEPRAADLTVEGEGLIKPRWHWALKIFIKRKAWARKVWK